MKMINYNRKKNIRSFCHKRGSAMAMVMMVFAILVVITLAIALLFNNNLKQSVHQEEHSQAYYLANSGVEIAVGGLLTQVGTEDAPQYYYEKYIHVFTTPQRDSFTFDNGIVDLSIQSKSIDGEQWLVIESTGTLDNGYSRTLVYRFREANPALIVWE